MYVIAKRVGTLGIRGTERKIDGKYYQYQLPEGFDFALYDGKFHDRLVASRDGNLYGETRHSNKDMLVYKKLRTETKKGIDYAVIIFSRKATEKMLGERKNKKGYIPLKKIINETFNIKEEETKEEKVRWRVYTRAIKYAEKEINKSTSGHYWFLKESLGDLAFEIALDVAKTYNGDGRNLEAYTRTYTEWRIRNYLKKEEPPMAIYSYGDMEESERVNNLKTSGRKKPGSTKHEEEDVEKKQARMSRCLNPEDYPLDKYPIKEESRRVRGRTQLGGIYVD